MAYAIRRYCPRSESLTDEVTVGDWDAMLEYCQADDGNMTYWKKYPDGSAIIHVARNNERIVYDIIEVK